MTPSTLLVSSEFRKRGDETTQLITWFDSDDSGDNFSIGVCGSASETGLGATVIGHVISHKM